MKQEIYETRQRAAELLDQAINIWRQSDHSDQLEGMEHDPVFALLMTALAYQTNESDSEIERFRQDVLDEYSRLLTPYEVGHAIPATAVIETGLQKGIPELILKERDTFTLKDTSYQFMPLLRSKVINATVSSITRLDGRRWKLVLQFLEPTNNLSGITFAIKDNRFRDLKVSIDGKLLPLVKPWHFANMPLQRSFSVDALLYNNAQMYQAAMTGFDLFTRQDTALFYIKEHDPKKYFRTESETAELVFDFTDIPDDFVFDKSIFSLNAVILVNAHINNATITSEEPIVRVAGYSESNGSKNSGQQLMHLIPPSKEQLFGKTPIEVRRIAADRFNQPTLVRLLNSLITKFNSDYYAFLNLRNTNLQPLVTQLQDAFSKLIEATRQKKLQNAAGVYLLLNKSDFISKTPISLDLEYLTTDGAGVNESLHQDSIFTLPVGLEMSATSQIAKPTTGFDEVNDAESIKSTMRYYMVTNNRIVTPADMKIFCYTELMNRYSIIPEMVRDITVKHMRQNTLGDCGYAIHVNIFLQDSMFIKRSFTDKIRQAEILLQKMMEVRSTGIYPIIVTIDINPETT
jgi:hypothetical protein